VPNQVAREVGLDEKNYSTHSINIGVYTALLNADARSQPMSGASEPSIPVPAEIGRAYVNPHNRQIKVLLPCERYFCVMHSSTQYCVDDEDHDDDEALCNVVDSSFDPPKHAAAMRSTEAEHLRTAANETAERGS
jgi:hypothetical protein